MQSPLLLWLVRHGETTWNSEGRLAGWSDVPLSENGRNQASALKGVLCDEPFAGVWASDLVRAVETARLAYGEVATDPRLREIHFGRLEGTDWRQIAPDLQEGLRRFTDFDAPGGESFAAFRQRVERFVESLAPGRHLIFTHGGVIRMLTQNLGCDRFVSNGALLSVDWTAQKLLAVKDTLG